MNKKLIFALVSLFVIAGCGSFGGSGRDRPITDVDIRIGTDGLELEFLSNAPPENVFEESPFPIAVELRNKGACHIGSQEGDCNTGRTGIIIFGFERAYAGVRMEEGAEEAKE